MSSIYKGVKAKLGEVEGENIICLHFHAFFMLSFKNDNRSFNFNFFFLKKVGKCLPVSASVWRRFSADCPIGILSECKTHDMVTITFACGSLFSAGV